jgi:hypothetical protein
MISLDTALEVIGFLFAHDCKTIRNENLERYENEKNILLGLKGTEEEKKQIFEKVEKVYCKQVRDLLL